MKDYDFDVFILMLVFVLLLTVVSILACRLVNALINQEERYNNDYWHIGFNDCLKQNDFYTNYLDGECKFSVNGTYFIMENCTLNRYVGKT